MLITFIALTYICGMIYLANRIATQPMFNWLLKLMQSGLIIVVLASSFSSLFFLLVSPEQVNDRQLANQIMQVNPMTALIYLVLSIGAIVLLTHLTYSNRIYQWFEHHAAPKTSEYRATSPIHQLAIILAIFQTVITFWVFMISGGLQGLNFTYDSPLTALASIANNAMIYVVIALLGVGWMTRRDFAQLLDRLGLRLPTKKDWIYGVSMAISLYCVALVATTLWALIVPEDIIAQQTTASQQLFESFSGSIVLGFLLALMTGFSEEILFRGALQPIFGLLPTTIFFALLHIQYTLTPATLILFVITLGFGFLRQNVSTTASIIAHVLYNFIPFLLFTIVSSAGTI